MNYLLYFPHLLDQNKKDGIKKMGNRHIDKQTIEKCFQQYIRELRVDGSIYECTSWGSMCKILHKVHFQTNYTDLLGDTIRIPSDIKREFIKAAAAYCKNTGMISLIK